MLGDGPVASCFGASVRERFAPPMARLFVVAAAAGLSLLAAPARAAALQPCPEATATAAPCLRTAPPCPQAEAPCQR